MTIRPSVLLLPLLLGVVSLLGSGFGCSMITNSENENREFLLATVDSVDVPDRIQSADTLSVRLFGQVGPNGCYSLEGVEEERAARRVTLRPVVRHMTADGIACTMALVPLETTYNVAPPFQEGILKLVIPQQNRADVTATVAVK